MASRKQQFLIPNLVLQILSGNEFVEEKYLTQRLSFTHTHTHTQRHCIPHQTVYGKPCHRVGFMFIDQNAKALFSFTHKLPILT
jgi:hypothetical protein